MGNSDAHRYDDIIHLPHHVSTRHPQMSALGRAAQFSPFAALVGYDAQVAEAGRLTDSRRELDEQRQAELDQRLQYLREHIAEHPKITVVHFVPDQRKEGGSYQVFEGAIKKLDEIKKSVVFEDGKEISVDALSAVEGNLFMNFVGHIILD